MEIWIIVFTTFSKVFVSIRWTFYTICFIQLFLSSIIINYFAVDFDLFQLHYLGVCSLLSWRPPPASCRFTSNFSLTITLTIIGHCCRPLFLFPVEGESREILSVCSRSVGVPKRSPNHQDFRGAASNTVATHEGRKVRARSLGRLFYNNLSTNEQCLLFLFISKITFL